MRRGGSRWRCFLVVRRWSERARGGTLLSVLRDGLSNQARESRWFLLLQDTLLMSGARCILTEFGVINRYQLFTIPDASLAEIPGCVKVSNHANKGTSFVTGGEKGLSENVGSSLVELVDLYVHFVVLDEEGMRVGR